MDSFVALILAFYGKSIKLYGSNIFVLEVEDHVISGYKLLTNNNIKVYHFNKSAVFTVLKVSNHIITKT